MKLYGPPERVHDLMRSSRGWPSLVLPPDQIARLELLLDGTLFPLAGFMTREMVETCVREWRLPDGGFWPVPVQLDVPRGAGETVQRGADVVLRDQEGSPLAVLHARDRWPADRAGIEHIGGPLEGLTPPRHYDFRPLRLAPEHVRAEMTRRGWNAVIAVQTDRAPHEAGIERIRRAADERGAALLLQAIAAPEGPGDERYYRRVRRFQTAVDALGAERALLMLLPLALDRSGPRGAALTALIARNYGCSHVVVDPSLLTAASAAAGVRPGALGVEPVDSRLFADAFADVDPDAAPPHEQGVTVFFTGLSGSGKSTIANALRVLLLERGGRRVTLLDGDLVRQHLSSELGFSREHRELNIRRIGFVAAEITKHGGFAICAPIAPYASTRRDVRRAVEAVGAFVLVFVDTPLEVCEGRDPKGLYARARAGLIPEFTGVSDPYEPPDDAEVIIRTTEVDAAGAAARIVEFLERAGYVPLQKIV